MKTPGETIDHLSDDAALHILAFVLRRDPGGTGVTAEGGQLRLDQCWELSSMSLTDEAGPSRRPRSAALCPGAAGRIGRLANARSTTGGIP
jgi:hypothetical protein